MAPSFVKRYSIAFGKYKVAGFAFLTVALAGAGVLGLQSPPPPTYAAKATLTLNASPAYLSATGGEIQAKGVETLSRDFLMNEYVLGKVAQATGVKPATLLERVSLKLPEKDAPPFYQISYRESKPEKAKVIVETMTEAMIQSSRQINQQRLEKIIKALQERLPTVEQELKGAEADLVKFEKVDGAAVTMAINGNLVGQITGSQQQQRQLQQQLEALDAQINSLQQRLGLTPDEAYASSALSADPIIANLRVQIYETESQIKLLSETLRPDHPQMIELTSKLTGFEQLLQQRAGEVLGGNGVAAPIISSGRIREDSSLDPTRQQIANQLVALQTQRTTVQRQIASAIENEQELTREFATLPNKQMERERLAKQLALKTAVYDQLQAKLADAETAKAETVSSLNLAGKVNVETLETPPQNMLLLLAIGAGVGLVGGAGLIYLLSALEGRYYVWEEVRGALQGQDVPVLGIIPSMISFDPDPNSLPTIASTSSPYLDYYERLRSNLRRASEQPPKMVLITSAGSQEGKTLTAYNLGIASARAGKRTLLIEADLRSPSQSAALKVVADPENNIDPLGHYNLGNDCMRLVPDVENLYIVPSPGPQQHAVAVLESSEMRRLLEDVRNRFDFIIIDAPSLSRCNDALLLEPFTDGTILVTRPGYTQGSLLTENMELLSETEDIEFLGAIINDAEIPVSIPYVLPQEATVAVEPTLHNGQENQPENLYSETEVPSRRR
jgi:capsular exopolysaccharide synthesis family protein